MAQQDLLITDTPNGGRAKINAQTQELYPLAGAGYTFKRAVRCAVSTNVAIATALENGDSAGGVTLATGDRVLLFGQTAGAENGIYTVPASGVASRSADANTSALLPAGMLVYVNEGTYADQAYSLTTNDPITLGTTSLTFAEFGGGPSAPDASTTVKGVTKLATAPTSSTDPIAVGDNDARVANVEHTTNKNSASGYAGLDSSSKLTASQIPNTAVSAGSYTNTDLTVGADGRITVASNGSGGASPYRTLVTLGSDQTNSTTTLADVTGLSFAVASGTTYRFSALIIYDVPSTGVGSGWDITFPSVTFSSRLIRWSSTTTAQSVAYQTSFANTSSAAAAGNICEVQGIVRPSASGTVQIRFRSSTAGQVLTAKAGSTIEWW